MHTLLDGYRSRLQEDRRQRDYAALVRAAAAGVLDVATEVGQPARTDRCTTPWAARQGHGHQAGLVPGHHRAEEATGGVGAATVRL